MSGRHEAPGSRPPRWWPVWVCCVTLLGLAGTILGLTLEQHR